MIYYKLIKVFGFKRLGKIFKRQVFMLSRVN